MTARASHLCLVAGASGAILTLIPVTLYQCGLLPRLPDPPGSFFDSERLVLSPAAHPFGVPDGPLGIASFATTLALALRAERSEAARLLLGAKVAGDVALASFNLVRQVVRFRRLCSWCTATALSTVLIAVGGQEAVHESWLVVQNRLF